MVAAAQQIGNAAGCAGGSNRCTTKVAQAAKLGLDADRDQVGKGHSAEHLLLVDIQPAGSCHNRHGSRNALIAAAGVCHHRDRRACHAGVRTGRSDDHGVGGQVAGHQTLAAVQFQIAANGKAVFLGKTLVADGRVHLYGAADDVDGVMQGVQFLGAVIPDGADGQKFCDLLRGHHIAVPCCGGVGVLLVQRSHAVLLHQHHVGVQIPHHRAAGVAVGSNNHLNVELLRHLCHLYLDLASPDKGCGFFHLLPGHIVHDLQQVDGVTAYGTNGGGVIHALIRGARNARRHGVFDNVDAGADGHGFYPCAARLAECCARLCGGESDCAGLRTAGGQLHLTVQDANEHLFIHLVHRFFSSRAGELTLQQCTRSPAERPWAACPPAPRCVRGRAAQNTRRTPCSSLQNR